MTQHYMSGSINRKDIMMSEEVTAEVPEEKSEGLSEEESKTNDEKMGKREAAISKDVLERVESESDNSEEEVKEYLPAFFMDEEDRHKVEVDLLFEKSTGRIKSVSRKGSLKAAGLEYDNFKYLTYISEWFEFSIPGYEQLTDYKRQSSSYNIAARRVVIDDIQRRNLILVGHLKDWSLRDREGKKIEIEFDENGALAEESAEMIGKVFPTLIEVVVTLFERDVILTTA